MGRIDLTICRFRAILSKICCGGRKDVTKREKTVAVAAFARSENTDVVGTCKRGWEEKDRKRWSPRTEFAESDVKITEAREHGKRRRG